LPRLRSLNLGATEVTGAGMAGLQDALPRCNIRHWVPPR